MYQKIIIKSKQFNEKTHHSKKFAELSVTASGNNQSSGIRKFIQLVTRIKICIKIDMHSNIII